MLPRFQMKKPKSSAKFHPRRELHQQSNAPTGQLWAQKVMDQLHGASEHPQDLQHPHLCQGSALREGHTDART